MKGRTKVALIVGLAVAVTVFINFPFGFYLIVDSAPDYLYGVHFFGNWVMPPSEVLDVAYILGAVSLNFSLFYGFFWVGNVLRGKKL